MNENKIKFWGVLDVSTAHLEAIPPDFEVLWKSGEYRMKPSDIERMEKYLKRLLAMHKQTKQTLIQFKNLNS